MKAVSEHLARPARRPGSPGLPVRSTHANTDIVCVPWATFGKDHITIPFGLTPGLVFAKAY